MIIGELIGQDWLRFHHPPNDLSNKNVSKFWRSGCLIRPSMKLSQRKTFREPESRFQLERLSMDSIEWKLSLSLKWLAFLNANRVYLIDGLNARISITFQFEEIASNFSLNFRVWNYRKLSWKDCILRFPNQFALDRIFSNRFTDKSS